MPPPRGPLLPAPRGPPRLSLAFPSLRLPKGPVLGAAAAPPRRRLRGGGSDVGHRLPLSRQLHVLQSAHMGPVTSLPPPEAEWKSAGGREGAGAEERKLCARRDLPLAVRAAAYNELVDWSQLGPRCLVR